MNKLNSINIDKRQFEIMEIEKNDKEFPKRLLDIKRCPKKIYAVGKISLLNKFSIAIVGSRKATRYGIENAKLFSSELSKLGITIISGLAIGIDYYAHISSTYEIGNTIAVLGGGLGKIYPKENIELFNLILKNNGCVITEYEFDEEVKPENFSVRNRIISGMSEGTLVVEARKKSGSTITGRYAIEQNKKLFCIPNSIYVKQAEGVNDLIKKGAILTRDINDVLRRISS